MGKEGWRKHLEANMEKKPVIALVLVFKLISKRSCNSHTGPSLLESDVQALSSALFPRHGWNEKPHIQKVNEGLLLPPTLSSSAGSRTESAREAPSGYI